MLSILIFLVLISIFLSIPAIQMRVAHWGSQWLRATYQMDLRVQKFAYTFPNRVAFEGLLLRDHRQDTLIYLRELESRLLGFNPRTNHLHLSSVEIEGLRFFWLTYPGAERSNFDHFLDHFESAAPDTTAGPDFGMDIGSLRILESRFWMEDLNCANCYRMDYQNLNLDAQDFQLRGSAVAATFRQARWHDPYGLTMEQLSGRLSYSDTSIGASDLRLRTDGSHLVGDLALRYASVEALAAFEDSVQLEARWEESRLRLKEVENYAGSLPELGTVGFSGSMSGNLQALKTQNLRLRLAQGTRLAGDFELRHLTHLDSFWLETPQFELNTRPEDMRFLASRFDTISWPAGWAAMGPTRLSGSFKGYLFDFGTKLSLKSEAIQAQTELHLAQKGPQNKFYYEGQLAWQKLKLGTLLKREDYGNSQGNWQIKGAGTRLPTMRAQVNGELLQAEYRGYSYDKATVQGKLEKGLFKGEIKVEDPHLAFQFSGQAGFEGDTGRYDFTAELKRAHLHELNLSEDSLTHLSARLDMNFEALSLQQWRGQIRLKDVAFTQQGQRYQTDSTVLRADGMGPFKFLDLQSPLAEARLTGRFTPQGLGEVANFYRRQYLHVDTGRAMEAPAQQFDLQVKLKRTQNLLGILSPQWEIAPGAEVHAAYTPQQGLQLETTVPALRFRNMLIRDGYVHYEGTYAQARLELAVNRLEIAGQRPIDSLQYTARQEGDSLQYRLGAVLRDSIDAYLHHEGMVHRQGLHRFDFKLDSLRFNVGRQYFSVAPDAHLILDSGRFYVQALTLRRGPDKVFISGAISSSPYEVLRMRFSQLNIKPFNYFLAGTGTRLKGELNGVVIGNQLLSRPRFLANMAVDSLQLNGDLLGSLSINSTYQPRGDSLEVAAKLTLGNLETLHLEGALEPVPGGALRADLMLNRFRVAALNPFVVGVAEDLRGMVDGQLRLRGTTTAPMLLGQVRLPKVAFTVSFLQTDYNLSGDPVVYFEEGKIRFPNLALRDTRFGTRGTLDGEIRHQSFSDFELDLHISGQELLVLNTPPSQNDAYYGTAFVGGDIHLKGSPEDMHVDATVRTQRNTHFSIPVVGSEEERRSEFVTFYNPREQEDSMAIRARTFQVEKGVSLDFDIQVDRDARIAIILDQETGNKMTATGTGPIKLKMDALGNMELFGIYTVAEGSYNFNLEGLLNKKFELLPGGTVSWSGDPYEAQLSLSARYVTKADPGVFLGNMVSTSPTRTEVYLEVSGRLTNPTIGFDIKLPRANSTVQAVLNNRLNTEEAMNQQVFSLLALNSFTPASNVFAGTGGGINQWDLLANQAASFLNRFTGDYEVSLSYQENQELSAPTDQELEVGLSKDFFNERLTINSSVGVPLNQQRSNVGIAGDFEVEYSLTQDGRLKARAFNRAVDNSFGLSLGQQQIYQQGIGLRYRVDFNRFSGLWQQIISGKGKQEEEARPQQAPE